MTVDELEREVRFGFWVFRKASSSMSLRRSQTRPCCNIIQNLPCGVTENSSEAFRAHSPWFVAEFRDEFSLLQEWKELLFAVKRTGSLESLPWESNYRSAGGVVWVRVTKKNRFIRVTPSGLQIGRLYFNGWFIPRNAWFLFWKGYFWRSLIFLKERVCQSIRKRRS